jgi:3-polyprenyl-4-hydroxybenzoate decarboxylase
LRNPCRHGELGFKASPWKPLMNEIVDIALPAEDVFHNLVFVNIRKTYPMQAYKIMHGLWGMGQMMFTKYIVVVDDMLDHATSEIAIGSKLGIDATKKLPGEVFKRPWSPLIKMSEEVRRKIDALFKTEPSQAAQVNGRTHSRLCLGFLLR